MAPFVTIATFHLDRIFVRVNATQLAQKAQSEVNTAVNPEFIELLRDALTRAISASKLYVIGDSIQTSDYILDVTVLRYLEIGDSIFNHSSTVHIMARWCLTNRISNFAICERDIATASTMAVFQISLLGRTLLRDSIEGAVSANIKQGILWLDRKAKIN